MGVHSTCLIQNMGGTSSFRNAEARPGLSNVFDLVAQNSRVSTQLAQALVIAWRLAATMWLRATLCRPLHGTHGCRSRPATGSAMPCLTFSNQLTAGSTHGYAVLHTIRPSVPRTPQYLDVSPRAVHTIFDPGLHLVPSFLTGRHQGIAK